MHVLLTNDLDAENRTKFESFQREAIEISTIEELVASAMRKRLTLSFLFDHEEGGGRLCIGIGEGHFSKPPTAFGFIFVEGKELRSLGRFKPVNTTIHTYADKKGEIPDLEWFENRDKRLRIKVDPWEGVVVAPPTALRELIMSYVLSEKGSAVVSNQIVEIKSGVPFAAMLELTSLPGDGNAVFNEKIAIPLNKLEALVEKRKLARRSNCVGSLV